MTDQTVATHGIQTEEPKLAPRPARPRLTSAERRAAQVAEIANQQSTLKSEAAERRAARALRADNHK